MQISFPCPDCGVELTTESSLGQRQALCPACDSSVTVPGTGTTPGAEIGGFRLERKIGQGGMGEVYLATQLSMQRPVALKILPQSMTPDPALLSRFRQ